MAKLMINTARTNGEVYTRRIGENEINNTETKLTWIPGNKPVMIPMAMPKNNTSKNSPTIQRLE